MKKTQLSKAITFAMTGAALSIGAISNASAITTTMYNMTTAGGYDTYQDPFGTGPLNTIDPTTGGVWGYHLGGTDGWQNGGFGANTKWIGTSSASSAAFGYTGQHLNWGLEITGGNGGTAEISTFDSFNRYNVYADIDTAKGAWSATNTGTGFGGWHHDLDVGLFRTDLTGTVTLSIDGLINTGSASNFGFTIFRGVNTNPGYNHHAGWNANNNAQPGAPTAASTIAGSSFTTSDIVAYSVGSIAAYGSLPAQNLNMISFNAVAGQIYTIALGGYRNGTWSDTNDGYALTISQSAPVPISGAAWLFGGAIASLIGANRRKRVMPA